ncbi:MAG: InlB B-repeat-containing protein, partial [Dehalococcoidia bacterium]|nr:InlB B-repeat-containing protein [Dehalococcoidia bacterium]
VTSGLSIGDATPQAPTVTGEDGWVFAGWSPVPTATVTGNATYVAQWNTTYSVTYQPGTHGTFAPQVTSGLGIGDATPQAPAITGEDGWVFAGWSPVPTATVTGNATYVAQWNIVTPPPLDMCTVTFVDWDGRILKTEQVAHGSSATAPTNPLRSSYTFIGWDKSFDNITSDLTVTALYNGEATPPPPLAEEKDTWALLSLILAITGVLTAIAVSVYVLMRRKLNPMLLAVMALGIVGIIVFLLTQSVGSCGGLLP